MSNNIEQFISEFSTFLIGVTVVVVTLLLLILMLILLGKVINALDNKRANTELKNVAQEVKKAEEGIAVATVDKAESVDDLELVAVITAVIAASMGTTSDKLQVKSLRKVERRSL